MTSKYIDGVATEWVVTMRQSFMMQSQRKMSIFRFEPATMLNVIRRPTNPIF
jgi:hypothetical protein